MTITRVSKESFAGWLANTIFENGSLLDVAETHNEGDDVVVTFKDESQITLNVKETKNKYHVNVTEILNLKAWKADDECENEHEYARYHEHDIEAGTPQEALEIAKGFHEGENWYYISTDVKIKKNHFECHHTFNDELYKSVHGE